MPTPKKVTVFDTNGKLLDIDPNDLDKATSDGAERAVEMYDPTHPTNKHWTVRQSDVPDALKDGAYVLNPEDFSRNEFGNTPEGTYKMTGPGGNNPVPIPYSMVGSAAKNGYVMHPDDRQRYMKDASADPALKDAKLRPGVKAVGRNTAGQVMVAPDTPETPGFLGELGNTLAGGAAGLINLINPQMSQEEQAQYEKSGPAGRAFDYATWPVQRLVRPNFTESTRADEEQQAGHPYEAAMHAAASGVPMFGPMAEGMREQFANAESGPELLSADTAKRLAGAGVGNTFLMEAPHLAGPLASIMGNAFQFAPEGIRNWVRNLPGISLTEKTQKAIDNFNKESEQVRDANKAAEERTLKERGKVDEDNQAAQQKYSDDLNAHNQKVARLKKRHEDTIAAKQQQHADALKAHQDAVKQVQQDNIKAQQDHIAAVEKLAKDKQAAQGAMDQRQMIENRTAQNANELQERIQRAESDAKAADDQAWDAWRKKLDQNAAEAGQQQATADMSPVVDEINKQSANMTPSQVSEFRDIMKQSTPEIGGTTELEKLRNDITKNNLGGSNYDDLSPEKKEAVDKIIEQTNPDLAAQAKQGGTGKASAGEVPASRLHGWKSELERAVRNAKDGNVRYAIGQVLDQVRKLEQDVSKKYGADAELAAARKLHGPYVDAFVNSPNEPPTAASQFMKNVAPDFVSTNKLVDQGKQLGAYDPKIPELAETIRKDRETLAQLDRDFKDSKVREILAQQSPEPPEPKPLPKPPKPPLPPNEPTYPQPPKPPELNQYAEPKPTTPLPETGKIQRNLYRDLNFGLRKYGAVGPWVLRTIVGGEALHMLSQGHLSTFGTTMLIGQGAVSLLVHALRSPTVLDWLAKPSAEDLEMLSSLSGADQARVRQALGAMAAKDAEHLGGKLPPMNPRIAQFMLGSAIGQKQPTLEDLKKEAEKRKPEEPETPTEPEQQAAPEEAPGPQSRNTKVPYTHLWDETSGRIIPVAS